MHIGEANISVTPQQLHPQPLNIVHMRNSAVPFAADEAGNHVPLSTANGKSS